MPDGYVIKHVADTPGTPCPCGVSQRTITSADNDAASVHVVTIAQDSKPHYHKRLTEFYYVIEGRGELLIDGDSVALEPGTVACIKPGAVHVARGELKIINFVVPPFDPKDEYVVD